MRKVLETLRVTIPRDKVIAAELIAIGLLISGGGGLLGWAVGGLVFGVCLGVGSLLLQLGCLYLVGRAEAQDEADCRAEQLQQEKDAWFGA